ncbi:uncharacterized protein LOC115450236 [Manduca sexta]|uniref:uncharacterized protein LOC115450236 n=1 Tax=Manduca sexta TaxID=7130 RepID=UPI00188FB511|nr:uncharacterized protein LOC115450236 [Manduca sexta]
MVAEATGVSARTVMRIVSEGKVSLHNTGQVTFACPPKARERKKKINIDDAGMGAIRQKIHHFYTVDKTIPSIGRLNAALKKDGTINCGTTYLRELLHKMGYSFKKYESNKYKRPILVEKPIIGERRVTYLRAIRQYRYQNRRIYFLDETSVHCSHNNSKCWQSQSEPKMFEELSKGRRLIIVHCGSREGLVDGALMICRSDIKTGEHGDMTAANFYNWVDKQLKEKLAPNSVIVMNNAPYHSEQIEKKPTISSVKSSIQDWLREHNVDFNPEMTKPELLGLINRNQSGKTYKVDEMLKAAGHIVLRLPPHHPDLNPMQRVWAEVKQNLSTNFPHSTMEEKITILTKLFAEFPADKWRLCNDHVQVVENMYWDNDVNFDNVIDELIIKQENESDSGEGEGSENEEMLYSDEEDNMSE